LASWLRGLPALALIAFAGCGGDSGVADDATVSVYVAASLCAEAEGVAARQGDEAGGLRVRVICLPAAEAEGRLDLAQIGANARRATEDSSAVGYIGEPSAAATRFSRPILAEAEIPQLAEVGGRAAMEELLGAIERADRSSGMRGAVADVL